MNSLVEESILRKKIDELLDEWFRPHQDYIYNPHTTKDFLDAVTKLIREREIKLLEDTIAWQAIDNCDLETWIGYHNAILNQLKKESK